MEDNRTQAQKWEQSEESKVRDAWQEVWETIRAMRIACTPSEWAYSDDAFLLAAEFADKIVGEQVETANPEWEDLVDKCVMEIERLL